ncbi:cytochrome P450 [Nocardiopsis dassonvillei]|nr:cytochrome P450 [Nocardiopsis dassonvillei]MCK9870433.1 cytochrome P450 [Nocardiopsis dassonvillei]
MSAPQTTPVAGPAITHPITVGSPEFLADPHAHYAWLREKAPVYRGRMAYMGGQDVWLVSRYADCRKLLSDARFQRSPQGRGPAMIARMPDSVREPMRLLTTSSMIMMDDPGHRRLRGLVVKPFTPKAIARLGDRVGDLANSLLDELEPSGRTELRERFALPIPATVINEMVGVPYEDRDRFGQGMKALITGMAEIGQADWVREVNTLTGFVRELIDRKRSDPGPDILTGLIQAEEQGDRLSDDELVAMVFLLVTAGYETTYNLITSAVVTLLDHPRQLARLRDAPEDEALWRGAVEEILRYGSPLGGPNRSPPSRTSPGTAPRSRPGRRSSRCWARPTAIRRPSTHPRSSTSAVARTTTWASVTACTSAWVRTSPAWRPGSRWARCSGATRTCGWPSTVPNSNSSPCRSGPATVSSPSTSADPSEGAPPPSAPGSRGRRATPAVSR